MFTPFAFVKTAGTVGPPAPPSPPPTSGLVFALDAGDPACYPGTGTSVYDLSPYAAVGTKEANVSWNSAGYFGFVDNQGATSRIYFGPASQYDTISTTATFTYFAYIMPLDGNSMYWMDKSDRAYDRLSLVYGYAGEACNVWNGNYNGMTAVSMPANELNTVAFTKDTNGLSNNYKSYKNGNIVTTTTSTFSISAAQNGITFNTLDYGNFRVYNYYVYNRALTAQEVSDIHLYVTS